jgi:DNA repair protein RecO (recombination protein O)
MEWRDEGLIIGLRRHGESNVIIETMTREHGRHLGIVRHGRGPRMAPVLQLGNRIAITWRARLEEHLGSYAVEGLELSAGRFLASASALYGLATLAALARYLPERDPHPAIYDALLAVIAVLDDASIAGPMVARFELAVLTELGFGLDLEECAATGMKQNLIYVSPKSGRAVSSHAGEAYKHRLLALPGFMAGHHETAPVAADLRNAFALTGFFLERNVLGPRGLQMPDERGRFLETVLVEMQRTEADLTTR